MDEERLLDGNVTVTWTGAYVRVWHRQNASDLEELRLILTTIDGALQANATGYLLFDSRDVDYTPGDVQQGIWDWLAAHDKLVRIATLVESEALAVSVNMNGLGKRIPIRASTTRSAPPSGSRADAGCAERGRVLTAGLSGLDFRGESPLRGSAGAARRSRARE